MIAVYHLVNHANGMEPFRRFLKSYQSHSAGIPHHFVIVFKGFSAANSGPWRDLCESVDCGFVYLLDRGFDLTSYRILNDMPPCPEYNVPESDKVMFLSSFSSVMADDWLAKFDHVLAEDVGIVGASGSMESFRSNTHSPFHCLHFAPFPNYHIHTNAFLIRREVMKRIWPTWFRNEYDCRVFESGRNGATKRLETLGLKVLVVGKNGRAYKKNEWWQSETFLSGSQSNLLISDNQNDRHQIETKDAGMVLSNVSWRT